MKSDVQQIIWQPTKSDADKGRWLLDSADLTLPDGFTAAQSAFVGLQPDGWAANHRHQRREILLGLAGDLWLIWREHDGTRREVPLLRTDDSLQIFVIAPNTPHLVENRSGHANGALYEWSDLIDESIVLEGAESLRAQAV